ncbi:MAG TPA: Hpt domain-containing protein, partial [Candidatus Wallbacteria bacterium]|nr:Hpt domain-containing protein [Candidatus Wallbacteria bacterium]
MNASDDLKESRELFLAEAGDYLELLNAELLKLEKISDRESQASSLDNMFRAAHSIKGMSGMMNFKKINKLTHKMENILDSIRQGKQKFADDIIELLFKCFDLLTALVSAVSQYETEDETVDIEDAIGEIDAVISGKASGKPGSKAPSSAGSGASVNLSLSISEAVRASLKDFEDLNLFIAERSPDNIFEIEVTAGLDAQDYSDTGAFWISLKQNGEIVHCTPELKSISDVLKAAPESHDIKINIVYQTKQSAEKIRSLFNDERISVRDLREPFTVSGIGAGDKGERKFENSSYLNIFIEESYEDIEKMNEALLELERNPEDSENFNTVMRVMHSLKSSSAAVGFNNISTLAHAVESLLVAFKNSKSTITSETITLLLGSVDGIRNFLALAAEGSGHEIDLSEDVMAFSRLIQSYGFSGTGRDASKNSGDAIANNDFKLNEYESALLAECLESGKKAFRVDVTIEENAPMKAMRYLLVVSNYKESGEVIKCVPESEDEFEKQNSLDMSILYVSGEDDPEKIKKIGDVDQIKDITACLYSHGKAVDQANIDKGRREEELEVLRPAMKKAEKTLNSTMDAGIGAD